MPRGVLIMARTNIKGKINPSMRNFSNVVFVNAHSFKNSFVILVIIVPIIITIPCDS